MTIAVWRSTAGIVLAAIAVLGCTSPKTAPDTVAIVENKAISKSDLDGRVQQELTALRPIGCEVPASLKEQLAGEALEALIDDELIRKESATKGISVAPAALETRLQEHVAQFGSEEEFEEHLARAGIDRNNVRQRLGMQMLREALAARLQDDVRVDDNEVSSAQEAATAATESDRGIEPPTAPRGAGFPGILDAGPSRAAEVKSALVQHKKDFLIARLLPALREKYSVKILRGREH